MSSTPRSVIAPVVRLDPALEGFALPEAVAMQLTVPGGVAVVVNRRWKETAVLTIRLLQNQLLHWCGCVLDWIADVIGGWYACATRTLLHGWQYLQIAISRPQHLATNKQEMVMPLFVIVARASGHHNATHCNVSHCHCCKAVVPAVASVMAKLFHQSYNMPRPYHLLCILHESVEQRSWDASNPRCLGQRCRQILHHQC